MAKIYSRRFPVLLRKYPVFFGLGVIVVGFVLGYFVYETQAKRIGSAVLLEQEYSPGVHQSYISAPSFFDKAYKQAPPIAPAGFDKKQVRAVLVPHHLLAARFIAQAMEGVASEEITQVVLLSPNHFGLGNGQIITSQYVWDTPYGALLPGKELADVFLRSGQAAVDENPFKREHGVSGIVPFVKRSFPNARVVPIIVKDTLTPTAADAFAKVLASHLDEHTLLVASFDFSHYLPERVANFHDAKSEALLHTLDPEGARYLDIDSKPGLRIVLRAMQLLETEQKMGTLQYFPVAHTSANTLLGDPESFENTSYFTGYFLRGENGRVTVPRATVHVFGDIMLDRTVRTTLDKKGSSFPFEKIKRFMDGADIGLANLETPITPNPSKTYPGGPLTFTSDPKHLGTLKRSGITLVSLANNHTLNFGAVGLQQTREYLRKNEIGFFGDPSNREQLSRIETVRGMRIGFVGFHQFVNNDPRIISREIVRIRPQADFIVVMPHWGAEYQTTSWAKGQEQAAHQWIDSGADVVIGAHPHVVQPFEEYKGKMIFYSLGNFVFDQQFSEDVKTELSIGLVIEPTKVMYYLFPMYNEKMQVELLGTVRRDALLSSLAKHARVSESVRGQIIRGVLELTR